MCDYIANFLSTNREEQVDIHFDGQSNISSALGKRKIGSRLWGTRNLSRIITPFQRPGGRSCTDLSSEADWTTYSRVKTLDPPWEQLPPHKSRLSGVFSDIVRRLHITIVLSGSDSDWLLTEVEDFRRLRFLFHEEAICLGAVLFNLLRCCQQLACHIKVSALNMRTCVFWAM